MVYSGNFTEFEASFKYATRIIYRFNNYMLENRADPNLKHIILFSLKKQTVTKWTGLN
jgi:hypothetical protein